jgi:hypothetical protein
MIPKSEAITKIFLSPNNLNGEPTFTLQHSMEMHEDSSLSGWIRVTQSVDEANISNTTIEAAFCLGTFSIPVTGALTPAGAYSSCSTSQSLRLVLTPNEWLFETAPEFKTPIPQLECIKLLPASRTNSQVQATPILSVINIDHVYAHVFPYIKNKLRPYGFNISLPSASPWIEFGNNDEDSLLSIYHGFVLHGHEQRYSFIPDCILVNLSDGSISIHATSSRPKDNDPKVTIHSSHDHNSYSVNLADRYPVFQGARAPQFQFAHSSWLWSYSKVKVKEMERSTWIRWPIPLEAEKSETSFGTQNRLHLDCRLLFQPNQDCITISSCSINTLAEASISVDDSGLTIIASDLDIELTVDGFSFLPSLGQGTSNPPSHNWRPLASPEAAPALLEPSSDVRRASLVFRSALSQDPHPLTLQPLQANGVFKLESDTSDVKISGEIYILEPIKHETALLTLPSVSDQNLDTQSIEAAPWDPNQGKALRALSFLELHANSVIVAIDCDRSSETTPPPLAIRTLLPWVEWKPNEAFFYHRNLVCDFDEWTIAGVDSASSMSGKNYQDCHFLNYIHDVYAKAADKSSNHKLTNWWPGLNVSPGSTLSLDAPINLSSDFTKTKAILPALIRNEFKLSLEQDQGQSPWLDASIAEVTIGDNHLISVSINNSPYSYDKTCLSTDLLVKAKQFFDQGGFLRTPPVAATPDKICYQQLYSYSSASDKKSLFRISGTYANGNSRSIHITFLFIDLLLELNQDRDSASVEPCRLNPVRSKIDPYSRESLLNSGTVLLSGTGICGCPIEFTRLIFLETAHNNGSPDFDQIIAICFEGVLSLLRSADDGSEPLRVDVKARFTLRNQSEAKPILIEPISFSGTPSNFDLSLPSARVARFPHSAIASPIREISGSIELENDKLLLKSITANVEFLGSLPVISPFPNLYTVDGLKWTSLPIFAPNAKAPEPIWSWPIASQQVQNDASPQETWQLIPFKCVPPSKPSEFQASLAGMLWSNPQEGLFRFYRFLDPESPVDYQFSPSEGEIIGWDLLSTDLLRPGSNDDHFRLLAVLSTPPDQKIRLQIIDEQGTSLCIDEFVQPEAATHKPIMVQWLNSSGLLAVSIGDTLWFFFYNVITPALPVATKTIANSQSLFGIYPYLDDATTKSLSLITIYKASSLTITLTYPPGDSAPSFTPISVSGSVDKALILSDQLAVRVQEEGWYLCSLGDLNNLPANGKLLPESKCIEAIAEHAGALYAAIPDPDQPGQSKILRLIPAAAESGESLKWEHVTTLPALIESSMSTPLGPWWFSKNNQAIFGMDGVVEWDAKGLRAQLAFDCPIVTPSESNDSTPGNEEQPAPTLHWRTTWGNTAWLQLSHTQLSSTLAPGAGEIALPSSQRRDLALARDVQEGQIAFTIPDFQPPSHLSLQDKEWIWHSGALLLWNEAGIDSSTIRLGGALITEGVCRWSLLNVSIKGFTEDPPNSPSLAHCLTIGWSHAGEWKSNRRVTAALARNDGWTLQLHEQTLNKISSYSCMGLLTYSESNGGGQCQMPVILNTSSSDDGQSQLCIQQGLYRLSTHSTSSGSGQLDLCLHRTGPDSTRITHEYYDIEPLRTPDPSKDEWVVLKSDNNGQPTLATIRKEVVPSYLDDSITVPGPKQPIREIQFGHRRIFGARLRFLNETVSAIDSEKALLRHQAYTYYNSSGQSDCDDGEDNPDVGFDVIRLLHQRETKAMDDWKAFSNYWIQSASPLSPQQGSQQVWNSGCNDPPDHTPRGWRIIKDPTDRDLRKGDCIVTWPMAGAGGIGFQPPSQDQTFNIASLSCKWTGALLAQREKKIVLIREPFWQSKKSDVTPRSWRSENLLIMGRCPATTHPDGQPVPVLACLRSVTDVVEGDTTLRGLSDDEARTWLLAHGSQGFPVRRVCIDQGPSRYQFLRSPFVQAAQDQEIISASTSELDSVVVSSAEPQSTPNPLLPLSAASPKSSNSLPILFPYYYQPVDITSEPESTPVPVFRAPQRRVRLRLQLIYPNNPPTNTSQIENSMKTLLLHEAVAYPNRIHNSPPLNINQQQTRPEESGAHSFLPECIDFAYGTDKPGGMVIHSVTPRVTSMPSDNTPQPATGDHVHGDWGQGPLTEFLMRDPLNYYPPKSSALQVRSCSILKDNVYYAHLLYDDILGSIKQPDACPLFNANDQSVPQDDPPQADPPFTFNPKAIRILSRVGDQLFIIDQDSDFIPCDEARQIFILTKQSSKSFFDNTPIPAGNRRDFYGFVLNGFQLPDPGNTVEQDESNNDFCLSPLTIDHQVNGNSVESLALSWTVTLNPPTGATPWFYCYFNRRFSTDLASVKTLPIRVMPTLATSKTAVVLQQSMQKNSKPEVIRESTELFGSANSSRLSFSPTSRGEDSKDLSLFVQYNVKWELRDHNWASCSTNQPEVKTNVIVVKYLPDGASLYASKAVVMPNANA